MKKRALSLILALVLVVGLLPMTAMADTTVTEINTVADLYAFADKVNNGDTFEGKVVKLTSDIDLNGEAWTQITRFAGEFDGNNKTVSNFKIVESAEGAYDAKEDASGFFRCLDNGAYVHDLTLENVCVEANGTSSWGVGTLAGHIYKPNVKNVTVSNVNIEVTGNAAVGGMCSRGENAWDMSEYCFTDCTVKNLTINAPDGIGYAGGFIRICNASLFQYTNCRVDGFKLTAENKKNASVVGGFTAQTQTMHSWATFRNCHVTGLDFTVAGYIYVGGFTGRVGSQTIAENCTVSGVIDGSNVTDSGVFVGGFVGDIGWGNARKHQFVSCTTDVNIVSGGSAITGGFLATTDGANGNTATFRDCHVLGTVIGNNVGGFVGETKNEDDITLDDVTSGTTVIIPDGKTATVDENGVVTIPRGSAIIKTDGTTEVTTDEIYIYLYDTQDSVVNLIPILDDISFVDVFATHYFYDAVKWAYHAGVTGGTDAWHFSPDAGCTRAQIVTFLWRAAGCPSATYLGNFTDVDANAYYATAVAWAVENGITNGTSATTFSPEAVCTRADAVTFLYRAFGRNPNYTANFSDVPAGAYYADAVAWAAENNITGGTGNGKFSPADTCSRAQIVTFLYRTLG